MSDSTARRRADQGAGRVSPGGPGAEPQDGGGRPTRGPGATADPLAPARGILIGVALGALAWLVFFAVVLDWFGTSVMAELGRRAVESGIIP